jgi:6-phosphogluconate dehydrogenase
MQLGMVGAGRMGANMVLRLLAARHQCVVYDVSPAATQALAKDGATAAASLEELVQKLEPPRAVWVMLPHELVDAEIAKIAALLAPGDIVIDGGNSHFRDDIRRAGELAQRGVRYVDVGTSGGIAGRVRGYCLMIGGDAEAVQRLGPIFASLAPGVDAASRTPSRSGPLDTAEQGYLHCGGPGAGHFVKMVHNAIEYGLMAAYAEGMNLMKEHPGYDLDLARITELWRRGSVVSSWLLDLTARALLSDPQLGSHSQRVGDSGEGRWALQAAIEDSVPSPVLAAALFERFGSRGRSEFANRVLSAMRYGFGGHE